jgi:UDP-glucuronate 4-epimerase|tara:strand:+ start:3389 stop:4399 length:1011 start_codon:yes stop_codon:yes gene_type:complete
MKILVTGSAGFIGSELSVKLLAQGEVVVGVDNHNDYYDIKLKEDRLARYLDHNNYTHYRVSIDNQKEVERIFNDHKFDVVINLAAQAGVRYSIENPHSYIDSNIYGFLNILEQCKLNKIKHLIYASSSSVYGLNRKMPYSTDDTTSHPVSLYAATKKSNELMAHCYSHLFNLKTTGLRFFTVYGPWDRPDMALQKFTNAIVNGEKLDLYNFGKHKRDFTYIDDIVEGITLVIDQSSEENFKWDPNKPSLRGSSAPYRIFNIGNNQSIELLDYISEIERNLGLKADKNLLPLQAGDVEDTYADITDLSDTYSFIPKTSIKEGVKKFIEWYKVYHNIN